MVRANVATGVGRCQTTGIVIVSRTIEILNRSSICCSGIIGIAGLQSLIGYIAVIRKDFPEAVGDLFLFIFAYPSGPERLLVLFHIPQWDGYISIYSCFHLRQRRFLSLRINHRAC